MACRVIGEVLHADSTIVGKAGQLRIPALARHMWGLEYGDSMSLFDLGEAVLLTPKSNKEQFNQEIVPLLGKFSMYRLGHVTLPISIRRRWDITDGGALEYALLTDSLLYSPGVLSRVLDIKPPTLEQQKITAA